MIPSQPPEFYPSPVVPAKALTVVVHGLNNKPAAMKALADFLCWHGSDVVLVSLSGHMANRLQMQQVSREIWHHDLYQAYQYALSLINKTGPRPMYFLGYSLGALANLDLMTQVPEVKYDKMVLLAPANALRRRVQLLQPLCSLLLRKSWEIPSLTPPAYRAGKFTTVQAYRVLFEMGTALEKKTYIHLHIPTLVIIDPSDEMISLRKLKKLQEKFDLNTWQIYLLKDVADKKIAYHHLILDENAAGKTRWNEMQTVIKTFLHLTD